MNTITTPIDHTQLLRKIVAEAITRIVNTYGDGDPDVSHVMIDEVIELYSNDCDEEATLADTVRHWYFANDDEDEDEIGQPLSPRSTALQDSLEREGNHMELAIPCEKCDHETTITLMVEPDAAWLLSNGSFSVR